MNFRVTFQTLQHTSIYLYNASFTPKDLKHPQLNNKQLFLPGYILSF